MKLLFIGDIVASCGRNMLARHMGEIREKYSIDFVIVNGENAAHGRGLTLNIAEELFEIGADVITTGNHVWNNKEIYNILECNPHVLRPANLPASNPGKGSVICEKDGYRIGVINLMGRTFMEANDCPFAVADREIEQMGNEADVIFVDFHAEATSEKMALGWYLDGRVGAVVGTHTHIQTADEKILPQGTAYLTDAGMTGAYYSVLGMERKMIVERFRTHLPQRFELADGAAQLNGVVVEFAQDTKKAVDIQRINFTDF